MINQSQKKPRSAMGRPIRSRTTLFAPFFSDQPPSGEHTARANVPVSKIATPTLSSRSMISAGPCTSTPQVIVTSGWLWAASSSNGSICGWWIGLIDGQPVGPGWLVSIHSSVSPAPFFHSYRLLVPPSATRSVGEAEFPSWAPSTRCGPWSPLSPSSPLRSARQ